jgi:DUF971 family protein
MRPEDLQQIGTDLAIKWEDGEESFIPLEKLRRECPCAGCQGERDVMGTLHRGPVQPLSAASFQLKRWSTVGQYAIQPVWGDGHGSGIYSFEYLRRLAQTGD